MKKLKSSLLNMVMALTSVAVIMGGILAFVNHLTEGPIAAQKVKALNDGIKVVMCADGVAVAKTDTVRQNDAKGKEMTYIIYQIHDAKGQDLGAAVESTTGGFGGDLKAKDNLRQIFQQPFNSDEWQQMLHYYFQATELRAEPERIDGTTDDEQGYYLGAIDTVDSYRIGLFYYQIQHGNVARKRVGLRNLVKSFVNPNWGGHR